MGKKKTKKSKGAKRASKRVRAKQPAKGRRFTKEQQEHALTLVVSGMKRTKVAKTVGTTVESLRRWVSAAVANGTMPKLPGTAPSPSEPTSTAATKGTKPRSLYAPKDPGQGLGEMEQAAILELKKRHPSMGPAQIRAQLKRFKKWRVSIKAIARVLRDHGYVFGAAARSSGRSAAGALRGTASQRVVAARLRGDAGERRAPATLGGARRLLALLRRAPAR